MKANRRIRIPQSSWEMPSSIVLGRGIGPVRFGMYPGETAAALGNPQGLDLTHPCKNTGAIIHQYPHLGINLTFDEEDNHRLAYIDVVDGHFVLMNALSLGMSWAECEKAARHLGLGEPTIETCSTWTLLCFHKQSLVCWFQDGTLEKLSFGHYWSQDGQPLWPIA